MKKFFKTKIKSILTISSNRTGISSEKIKENFPYEFHKDKIESLLNNDNDVLKNKDNSNPNKDNFIYSLNKEYIKSNNFEKIEKEFYKFYILSIFICHLFKYFHFK